MDAGARRQQVLAGRRQARWLGAAGFAVALVGPVIVFHRVIAVLAQEPRLELHYLSGWVPWGLLLGGLAFLGPVAWSAGMDPESRWFPRARDAYAGWGSTLYLLGLALGWQVSAVQAAGPS